MTETRGDRLWRAFWIGACSIFDLGGEATRRDLREFHCEERRRRERRRDAWTQATNATSRLESHSRRPAS